jgi:uracil-DNA glycosylase
MSHPTLQTLSHDTLRFLEQLRAGGRTHLHGTFLSGTARETSARTQTTAKKSAPFASPDRIPCPRDQVPQAEAGEKKAKLEEFRKKVLACTQCAHLVAFRHHVVFGVGNPAAELMFVGEAPGADEDLQGEPFVGKAGQLLTKMIQAMGFQRDDVYIANVLKCRPDVDSPAGNRKPTPNEMATCVPHLQEQIRIISPKVLVTLGDTAVKGLVPDLTDGITRLRGKWLQYQGIPLMPTFHPAYLLRNQSLSIKRQCWEDLLAVLDVLQIPVTDKQRGYFLSKN